MNFRPNRFISNRLDDSSRMAKSLPLVLFSGGIMRKKIFAVLFLVVLSAGAVFGQDTITPGKGPAASIFDLRLDTVWDYLVMLF